MQGRRVVTLDHSDLVSGVQRAMAEQLRRDGRLQSGMEIGLVFCLLTREEISVCCTVRRFGQALFELKGGRPQLCAVATQLALDKLEPDERRGLEPLAQVHWRAVRFTDGDGSADRFLADVEFYERVFPAGENRVLH